MNTFKFFLTDVLGMFLLRPFLIIILLIDHFLRIVRERVLDFHHSHRRPKRRIL